MNGNARLDGREQTMIDRCNPLTIPTNECPDRPTYYGVVADGGETVVIRCYRDIKAHERASTVPEGRRFPDDASAILAMRELNDALLFGGVS